MNKMQTIKVRDYGDDRVNRLAVILAVIKKMDEGELEAALAFIGGYYRGSHA